MKNIVKKISHLEKQLSIINGPFELFGLFEQEDDNNRRWDLIMAAPWMDSNRVAATKNISEQMNPHLSIEELREIRFILVIHTKDPVLDTLHKLVEEEHPVGSLEHGSLTLTDFEFAQVDIRRAVIITCQKTELEPQPA